MNYVYEYTRHTSIWYPIIPYMCFIIHRTYNDTLEYLLRLWLHLYVEYFTILLHTHNNAECISISNSI